MIGALLLTPALADAPDDEAVRALASKAIGKDVPAKYLCIERPELPNAVSGDPTPVGIKVKNRGCVLKGVIIDGTWVAPSSALIAAVPGWSGLSKDTKSEVAVHWVRDVLLAFDQPTSAGSFDGKTVRLEGAWRVPKPQHAATGELQFTMGNDGKVQRKAVSSKTYRTRLVSRTNKVRGLTGEQLSAGVRSKGKLLQECVRKAWSKDLTVAGTSRLRWSVVEGKTTGVESTAWGTNELLRCYSGVLHQIEWEADGAIDYSLVISRDLIPD